ncbi:MAG: response regulator [Candidatus Scalindua sp.]
MNNRILLVDDEETIRYVLKEALVSEGYKVDVARDAFQAMERFKTAPYDLIITDIKMRGMDGIQLIREIKKSDSHLKIVIITAYGSLETVKEAAKLGVVEMISKPFKIQEIKDVLVRMLNNSSISNDTDKESACPLQSNDSEQSSKTDNLLKPGGMSYYFDGPACQPKSTVVFDSFAISKNRSMLIFGNINGQNEHRREWWENRQIGIMIKTLFRSKTGNTPKRVIDNISKFLYKNIFPHVKVSMLCVLIDKKKRVIKYVNSGNNLVCSMITPDGETEILETNPYLLGISPRIDLIEDTMPYSYQNRLMLSRSNSMSRIMEEGALIKHKIEKALQNMQSLQKKQSKEVDLHASFVNDKDVSLDDETVLLISLDRNDTEHFPDSKKRRIKK